jgi:surfeit locus 1 family protein
MRFRPYPVLTLFIVPALALLVWLGSWQLQRAEWKKGLIADFETQSKAEPVSLDTAFCRDGAAVGRIVKGPEVVAAVEPDAGQPAPAEIRMFGADDGGNAGWTHLVAGRAPPCIADIGPILIAVSFEGLDHSMHALTGGARYLVRAWPRKGQFDAVNSPETNDWHAYDGPAMATALRIAKLNPCCVLQPFAGELPDDLTRVPPAQHYGYAVTWFGMAIALLVIYGVFHIRAGRLSFRKQDSAQA